MLCWQVELESENTKMVCWLQSRRKPEVNLRISLEKIPNIIWAVKKVYDVKLDEAPIKTWRVGGL